MRKFGTGKIIPENENLAKKASKLTPEQVKAIQEEGDERPAGRQEG